MEIRFRFGFFLSGFAGFPQKYANHELEQTVVNVSLGVIVGAIALSIILSLNYPSKYSENGECEEKSGAA
jgi:hypothetical protein